MTDIRDLIIANLKLQVKKQDEYLKYILKYACVTESDKSIRMTNFENDIASLKSQLLEQEDNELPKYPTSNRDFTMTDKITTHDLNDIDNSEEEKE
jgi:hypothetical protein